MKLYHPTKIGNLEIGGNIFLAPVAGYTDKAFRSLCVEQGANFSYTELVSAEALVRGSGASVEMLQGAPQEKLYAVQLFGGSPQTMAGAVKIVLENCTCSAVDINCGCPVPKVVKTGAGAALTRDADRLHEVAKAAVEAAGGVPVTVKIRSGWDASHISWKEAADAAISAGVAAITLHPRTRAQGYEGKADWSCLKELVAFANGRVAVFGSGDLFTPEDARDMILQTGCDGVMFARGAMGNPFIFSQTRSLFTAGVYEQPEPAARVQMGLRELALLSAEIGEARACREMRKRFCSYTKGIEGGAKLRAELVRAETAADYRRILLPSANNP